MNEQSDYIPPKQDHTPVGEEAPPGPDPKGYLPRHEPWRRRTHVQEDSRYKSPALATILSLLPGLGQVYVGYYQQGFTNILVVGTVISIMIQQIEPIMPIAGFFIVFFWLFNMIDAGRRATFYNQAVAGLSPTEIPEDMKMPGSRGTLFGGILLIAAGAILTGHTGFGYSLEWLESWWPIALVILGVYLIYRNVMERKKEDSESG